MVDNTRAKLVGELQLLLHTALERNITNVPSERVSAETINKDLLEHAQKVFNVAINQFLRQQEIAGITYNHITRSDALLEELKNALDEADTNCSTLMHTVTYTRQKTDLFEDLQIVLHNENNRQDKKKEIVEHLQTVIHKAVETFRNEDKCLLTPMVHEDTSLDSSILLSSDQIIDSEEEGQTHDGTSDCPCDVQQVMPRVKRKDLLPLKEDRIARWRRPAQEINVKKHREIKGELTKAEKVTKQFHHANSRKTKTRVHNKQQSNVPHNWNPAHPEFVSQYPNQSSDSVATSHKIQTCALTRPVTSFQRHTGGDRVRYRGGYYTERTCIPRPNSESHKIPEQSVQQRTRPSEYGTMIAQETPPNCERKPKWLKTRKSSPDLPCSSNHEEGENEHMCPENKVQAHFTGNYRSKVNQAVPKNVTPSIVRSKTKYSDLLDKISEMEKELRESMSSLDSDSG